MFYVLWLKPTEGEDWIYTLEQRFKPSGVDTAKLYSTAEFMKRDSARGSPTAGREQARTGETGGPPPGA